MQTIGIKDLQINPAKLTKALEAHEFTMITKRSKPIGIALAFDETIVTEGLQHALLLEAYKQGTLSLGQLSTTLKLDKKETLKMLSISGIDVIDYDFQDELHNLTELL
ncbi:MAG TPA: type II toxin-antitoxin system Phd/YefM family antitoxin [Epsilonproteobacteria bacterium]|nr:type II toxin-antitoxin system Phd/YefM family antitoxin [Campylobacterota bacterium]